MAKYLVLKSGESDMYRVVIDTECETNKLLVTVETRDEAIRQGLLAKEAGARFVAIHGPLGKVALEAYLR